jgi:hypothetical protein
MKNYNKKENNLMLLTKNQILANKNLQRETVAVDEWKGDVIVQEMNGNQRDKLERLITKHNGIENVDYIRATILSYCLVDEHGVPLFSEKDIIELGNQSAVVLTKLVEVARKLSKLGVESVDEAKKNLKNDQKESSTSN